MKNSPISDLKLIALIALYTIVAIYVVACTFQTIENLSVLGSSMLAFKPTFSVHNLLQPRKYGETHPQRFYGHLSNPINKVMDFAQRWIISARWDKNLTYFFNDFQMETSRGQIKWISHAKDVVGIYQTYGRSTVSIGGRVIFAVDENTETIYHIDAIGKLHVQPYSLEYKMDDVIAQVTEALEVCVEHYNAERHEEIARLEKQHDWQVVSDNFAWTERVEDRTKVMVWNMGHSTKRVEWARQWGRIHLDWSVSYKDEKGSYPVAYKVAIGDKVAWISHSLLSRTTRLHSKTLKHDGRSAFITGGDCPVAIDIPTWWLKKELGSDYADKLEPITRQAYCRLLNGSKKSYRR